jgi:hypothetical protein
MSPKKAAKPQSSSSLSERMAKIGSKGGLATSKIYGKEHFSELAKQSHRKHNKKAKRRAYHGGRKPKIQA